MAKTAFYTIKDDKYRIIFDEISNKFNDDILEIEIINDRNATSFRLVKEEVKELSEMLIKLINNE